MGVESIIWWCVHRFHRVVCTYEGLYATFGWCAASRGPMFEKGAKEGWVQTWGLVGKSLSLLSWSHKMEPIRNSILNQLPDTNTQNLSMVTDGWSPLPGFCEELLGHHSQKIKFLTDGREGLMASHHILCSLPFAASDSELPSFLYFWSSVFLWSWDVGVGNMLMLSRKAFSLKRASANNVLMQH